MTIWRNLLALVDPAAANPPRYPSPLADVEPPRSTVWAVPLTITDCGVLADALHAYDLEVRDVAFGDSNGSSTAREYANRMAELVGAAHVRGYQLVPLDVDWLPALEHLFNDMLRYPRTRRLPTTHPYGQLLRRARVHAGMAPLRGWALTRPYGTEWDRGEPVMPPHVDVNRPGGITRP